MVNKWRQTAHVNVIKAYRGGKYTWKKAQQIKADLEIHNSNVSTGRLPLNSPGSSKKQQTFALKNFFMF